MFSIPFWKREDTRRVLQWFRPKEMQIWLREKKGLGIITRILSGLVKEGILLNCHRYQFLIYFLSPINPEYSLEGQHWSRISNTLATWYEQLTHWKRPLCWKRLRAGGEEEERGWDGWMPSATQWTWVWANSRRLWRAGKPCVLQSFDSQRVGEDLATEQQALFYSGTVRSVPWGQMLHFWEP